MEMYTYSGKKIFANFGRNFVNSTSTAESRTRWEGVVAKSTVVPQ